MNNHYNKTIFQGEKNSNKKRYFEGWYYKNVNKKTDYTISFIPGVSYNSEDSHCFIQCIICNEKKQLSSYYFKYGIDKFTYQHTPFLVEIGDSKFYKDKVKIDLKNSEISVKGILTFENQQPLNVSPLCPNIMGIFSYVPRMECNHHIISMNHKVLGSLSVNDRQVDLNDGFGYMEKDWGRSFPSEYIWLQCNHFENKGVKLALSAANIPFLGFSFRGFFCSLFVDDKEYRFATYNRSKLKVNSAKDGKVNITLKRKNIELNIIGSVDDVQSLASPKNGIMNDSIKEGLAGKISISLVDKSSSYSLKSKGSSAGIEIMMEV